MKLVTRTFAVTFGGGLGAAAAYTALQLLANEGIPGLDRFQAEWREFRQYRAAKRTAQ